MEKSKYPIPGKEANEFDTANNSLYDLCQELAAVSPMCFAQAVHSYVIHCCGLIHILDHEAEFISPDTYFKQVAAIIRSQELDIRERFTIQSKFVANQFGIKADTVDIGDDDCGF